MGLIPSMETTLPADQTIEEDYAPVHFHSKVTELGMLELWCVSAQTDGRWKLEFSVRDEAEAKGSAWVVILAQHVQDYIVRLVLATHAGGPFALPAANQYIRWGASPRAAQALTLAAKVRALLDGRYNVSFEDIRRVYLPAMRHRVIVNFEAQAENIESDQVLLELLEKVPEKADS